MLTHTRPFLCMVNRCTKPTGFPTFNDLERHQKDCHGMQPTHGTDRYYKCKIPGCQSAQKLWGRKDNFKAHVLRKHPHNRTDWEKWLEASEHHPSSVEREALQRAKERKTKSQCSDNRSNFDFSNLGLMEQDFDSMLLDTAGIPGISQYYDNPTGQQGALLADLMSSSGSMPNTDYGLSGLDISHEQQLDPCLLSAEAYANELSLSFDDPNMMDDSSTAFLQATQQNSDYQIVPSEYIDYSANSVPRTFQATGYTYMMTNMKADPGSIMPKHEIKEEVQRSCPPRSTHPSHLPFSCDMCDKTMARLCDLT